jgi:hypothetical protein
MTSKGSAWLTANRSSSPDSERRVAAGSVNVSTTATRQPYAARQPNTAR